jgi:hypothetical protein
MRAALLCGEQHARVITGDTPMLTSYCGGRSGRLKRLQPKFRKGRHCRVEQGCDPSDRRRISLRSSNYSPACFASATAKPVALPPGRCLPTKSWRGVVMSSHRVGLNRKSSPGVIHHSRGSLVPSRSRHRSDCWRWARSERRSGWPPGLDHRHRFVYQRRGRSAGACNRPSPSLDREKQCLFPGSLTRCAIGETA